ncbi:hypothetical protein F4679DRAFT_544464 [Xylaria curta]|nr:hypothetical protein F4679DRAFT_544464 [Xylaria curta]
MFVLLQTDFLLVLSTASFLPSQPLTQIFTYLLSLSTPTWFSILCLALIPTPSNTSFLVVVFSEISWSWN